ncbi:hypothetical protein GCM10010207_54270 [Streptomyces atratus]|nr:hypothetical protein GCM10010207_54270 [Streptomyces atratus]
MGAEPPARACGRGRWADGGERGVVVCSWDAVCGLVVRHRDAVSGAVLRTWDAVRESMVGCWDAVRWPSLADYQGMATPPFGRRI